ncbi:formyltransferase family protein [Bradyrhizobium vignae]|uniref:formyltransferase family protein n=1 Tax=Bradyrhizobium TaxID=374 RepID=UPI00100B59C1|nr:formyltransferase family protein [Bradyrhizobium vignae]RXH01612.1 formyl transferase [Bradyrhizobium vignae]
MRLLLLADAHVGCDIVRWLIANHRKDIALIVTMSDNEIAAMARDADVRSLIFQSSAQVADFATSEGLAFDLGLMAWWPKIIRPPLLSLPRRGFINTHPSLLPYGRGKHYNFWSIVDRVPFGVSLHMVDQGVDSGDIVAQVELPSDWEDTGGSLYRKATEAMLELVQKTYPRLVGLDFETRPQNLEAGTFHRASELEPASVIDLDKAYAARDLLNMLRARTFPAHPACIFSDGDDVYEVRVEIKRKMR